MNYSKGLLVFLIALFMALFPLWMNFQETSQYITFFILYVLILINLSIVLYKTSYTSDLSKQELERQKSERKK